jgi:MFS family permease
MMAGQDQFSTSDDVIPATVPTAASIEERMVSGESGGGRRGPLSPLRKRNFRLLFIGQLISTLGDQAYGVALPWTVLVVTGDPRQMAIVLAAEATPRVLFLLLGGVLADRLGPRLVMLIADIGRAGVVGALGVTLFVGLPPLWVVATLAALHGVGSGLFQPGSQALIPQTASDDELPAANGLMQTIQFFSLTIGPALGGIITAAQASVAFLADAASFAVSALTLFGIGLPRRSVRESAAAESTKDGAAKQKTGLLREVGAGVKYTFAHPLIRVGLMVTVVANFALNGALSVAIVVLINQMTNNALALGLVFGAAGVGGVLGGLSAGLLGRLPRRGVIALSLWIIIAALLALMPLVSGLAGQWPVDFDLLSVLPLGTLDTTTRLVAIGVLLGVIGFVLAIVDANYPECQSLPGSHRHRAVRMGPQVLGGVVSRFGRRCQGLHTTNYLYVYAPCALPLAAPSLLA